jgi:putative two-component system response regulator
MGHRILLVEDDVRVSGVLAEYLRSQGYECVVARDAEEGLQQAVASPPAVAIVDVVLPQASGIDLLTALRALRADMPVLLITGHPELQSAIEALRLSAEDYLIKPFPPSELGERLSRALQKQRIASREAEAPVGDEGAGGLSAEGWRVLVRSVEAICNALEAKDPYTNGHSQRVARLGQLLALEMGLTGREIETVRIAGALHDIGKIGVPEEVLNKPTTLTEAEWDQIKAHPGIGFRILRPLIGQPDVLAPVRHHHERMDGRGYPDGLPADEIGVASRVIALADGYDGMTSARAYRPRRDITYVVNELYRCAGTQWDEDVVEALFRTVPELAKRRAAIA